MNTHALHTRPITTLRRLLGNTNAKVKDRPENRQEAVYTGGNKHITRLIEEYKRATRNGDVNNHIAEHHLPGAPNEDIVQNHLNIALLNVF